MNSITVIGNLTRDPEIRYTANGSATATVGVAVNRRWQDANSGEWQEVTSFFDVVLWRDLAVNVAESLRKGDRVIVTGRLEQQSWETDAGERRSRVLITAEEIGPSLRWAVAQIQRTKRTEAPVGAGRNVAPVGAGSRNGSIPDDELDF
jgi:single-strand DNA-binding protein